MSNLKKMTWSELEDYLYKHHDAKGVIVFKQIPAWDKEYSLESRSYVVDGNANAFDSSKISTALPAGNLDGTDEDVRLDWYMKDPNPKYRWQVDYCYLLPEGE